MTLSLSSLINVLFLIVFSYQTSVPALANIPSSLIWGSFQISDTNMTVSPSSFTLTYEGNPTIANGAGTIALAKTNYNALILTPTQYSIGCNTTAINPTSLQVECKNEGTTFHYLVFNYLVYNKNQFILQDHPTLHSLFHHEESFGIAQSAQMGLFTKRTVLVTSPRQPHYVPNRFYKCVIFLRGYEFVSTVYQQSVNQTCDISDSNFVINFHISQGLKIKKIEFALFSIDMLELTYYKKMRVATVTAPYLGTTLLDNQMTNYHKNSYGYLFGLKSFTFQSGGIGNIVTSAIYPDTPFYLTGYFEIQYLFLQQLSCTNPTDKIDVYQKICYNSRNDCVNYEHFIQANSSITYAQLQKTYKAFAYSQSNVINVMRYNGTHFAKFSQIFDPTIDSGIIKFQFCPDFSRVAFLTLTKGFFIYAWNGTEYLAEHSVMKNILESLQFINFDISSDFKRVSIVYKSTSTGPTKYFIDILIFNATTQTYVITTHQQTNPLTHIFIIPNTTQAYLFNQQTFNKISLTSPTLASLQPTINIGQTSISDITISSNNLVIAIQYTRNGIGLTYPIYGIKILQYNPVTKTMEFHHRIEPKLYDNFVHSNNILRLSQDGLQLILQPIKSANGYRVIFKRLSTVAKFQIKQVVTNSQTSIIESNNHALATSSNFEFIISGGTNNTIVLFYCNEIIQKPYFLFTFLKAKPIDVDIIIPETPIQKPDDSYKVTELRNQISSVNQLKKAAISVTVLLMCLFICLIIYVVYKKCKKPAESLPVNNLSFSRQNTGNNFNSNIEIEDKQQGLQKRKRNPRKQKLPQSIMKPNASINSMDESLNDVPIIAE